MKNDEIDGLMIIQEEDVYPITQESFLFEVNGYSYLQLSEEKGEEYEALFASNKYAESFKIPIVIASWLNDELKIIGYANNAEVFSSRKRELYADKKFYAWAEAIEVNIIDSVYTIPFSEKGGSFKLLSKEDMKMVKEIISSSKTKKTPIVLKKPYFGPNKDLKISLENLDEAFEIFSHTRDVVVLKKLFDYMKKECELELTEEGYLIDGFQSSLMLGRPEDAYWFLELYMKQKPNDKILRYNKGALLMQLGHFKESIRLLHKLLQENPSDDKTMFILARAYEYLGYDATAYRWYTKINDKENTFNTLEIIKSLTENMPYMISEKHQYDVLDAYPIFLELDESYEPEKYTDEKGKARYVDLIRNKGVPITPEEKVRQKVIKYLIDKINTPKENILVEENLSHIDISLKDRVDILVWTYDGNKRRNLLLVECKAEGIVLEGNPTKQILKYNTIVNAPFIMLTNGDETQIFHFNKVTARYEALDGLKNYKEMCEEQQVSIIDMPTLTWARPALHKLSEAAIIEENKAKWNIGSATSDEKAALALNLMFCLQDEKNKIEIPYKTESCTIVEDYGVVAVSAGNAGGGSFSSFYRWLGVKDRNDIYRNVYYTISSIYSTEDEDNSDGKTALICLIEESGKPVSRLQISIDSSVHNVEGGYRITHNGIRSRRKKEPLYEFAKKNCPELVGVDNLFDLGLLPNNKEFYMSDESIKSFIAKLSAYLMLRSELAKIEDDEKRRNK